MFVIEREQNKRSEEAKRFWEVKSLEPTFLPKFGRPVMFVKDHMPFWVYVITEKGNKIKGLRSKSRFWEVKSLEPTFLPKFGRPVMFVIDHSRWNPLSCRSSAGPSCS
jgi:hypothetical protein